MDAQKLYKNLHKGHLAKDDQRCHSARRIAEITQDFIAPSTVIDVGCGVGHLLASFEDMDVSCVGLEGDWLKPEDAVCASDTIQHCDLEQPIVHGDRYDLAVCLEVAEHLEPARGPGFVADLCALSDVVVFSAAIEGQGGTGHKNEQWQDYWAKQFEQKEYRLYDLYRPKLWADDQVFDWFKQNMMLFVREGHPLEGKLAPYAIGISAARAIVPKYHEVKMRRLRREVRRLRKKLTSSASDAKYREQV